MTSQRSVSTASVSPDLNAFLSQTTNRRVIPVWRRILADGWTAVGVYHALCGDRSGTFLLESAAHGASWSRYSFVGVRSAAMLTEREGQAHWCGRVPLGLPQTGRAVDVIRDSLAVLATPADPDLPPFTGGLVGFMGYDTVRDFERVPNANPQEFVVPALSYLLATDLAVLDHHTGYLYLIANAINFDASDERAEEAWRDATRRLDQMQEALMRDVQLAPQQLPQDPGSLVYRSHTTKELFCANVERAKEYIAAGDCFQIVLSQRFSTPYAGSALTAYRALRVTNPSPYMYLIRIPRGEGEEWDALPLLDIVGSSPEALVTVHERHCVVHPIAGTRPRGHDENEDSRLASELAVDTKERAEHLMLVDLARNDLGRVCAPGSVDVVEFMAVERYSHVMHLVSTVTGTLADSRTSFDALAATFPAGTLSGAPKPRAMAIIDELEDVQRGVYGGCVGYLDFAGNLDTAIAIRTAVIHEGIAYVQAGAGVVADSDPLTEYEECVNKSRAVLNALALASRFDVEDASR